MNLVEIKLEDEPNCLKKLRGENRLYSDLKDECLDKTRSLLNRDQHGICAYCEQNFRSVVFIEHYITQESDESRVLDYDNFLGVCSGKEYFDPKESPKHIAHCGNNRGSDQLSLDPRDKEHISEIYYESDAGIRSSNADHDLDLTKTLNLNFDILKSRRNQTYKRNYSNLIKVSKLHGWDKKEGIERAIEILQKKKSEFNGYLLYRYALLK
jgi:uncharacterized protein (TIGR02646 family)